jgi:RHS repeat-associated protein
LGYTYSSTNQLQSITDASGSNTGLVNGTTTYSYDANGNLQSNANTTNATQNKSFTYNLLNLPMVATVSNGTATYTYDAAGNKLRKVSVINGVTTTTEYISGIQYKNSTTAVDFIQTEEGKAVNNSGTYDYNYYLGDNLGNTRVTFGTKTGTAVLYQQDDYYPFGMEINRTVNSPKNEYLYNKKELQEELGQLDYGARFYDPVIGRFTTVDPKAEKDRRWSPYNYVVDNPIRLIDPDGMAWIEGADKNVNGGQATYTVNADGTLNWTNATAGTQTIGNAFAASGDISDLNAYRDAKQEVDLNYSSDTNPVENGHTDNFPGTVPGEPSKSVVTVYGGNIDEMQTKVDAGTTYKGEKGKLMTAALQLGDKQAVIAGVAGHERIHATNPENIKQAAEIKKKGGSSAPNEIAPNAHEVEVLKKAVVKDVLKSIPIF